MVQLIEGYVFSPFKFCSAFSDRGKLGFGGRVAGIPASEVNTPGILQKLRARAVLTFPDFLQLLRHFRRERDRHGEKKLPSQHPMIG